MAKRSTLVLALAISSAPLTLAALAACGPSSAPLPPAEPVAIAASTASPISGPAPRAATRTFEHRAPAPGDHFRARTHALSSYPNQEGIPTGEAYDSDYELVVSRADGDAISEATVTFHTNARHAWHGANDDYNHTDPKPTPLEGKSLRVRAEPLSVQDSSGGAVSADVEKLALDIVSDIGMRGAMDAAIPDRVLVPGDRVDPLAPALVRVLNPRTWHFESGTATLRELTATDGTFDVVLHVKTESGNTLVLGGAVNVRRSDRRITIVALKGTFVGSGDDPLHGEMIYQRVVE